MNRRPPGVRAYVLLVALTLSVPAVLMAQRAPRQDRIAFTRVREDVRTEGDYRVEAEIWTMNVDGSDARRLTSNKSDDYGVAWSPDGTTLVFGAVQFAPDSTGELTPRTAHIYRISADGGIATLISPRGFRAQFPSWSADGRFIVFHGSQGIGDNTSLDIYVMKPDGSDLRQLTSNARADTRPDWSPDGRRIAYSSNRSGSNQIHVMNSDGSGDVQITTVAQGARNQAPDWSPDGTKIVFVSNRDGDTEIYVMNADGSDQQRLTDNPTSDDDPEWSFDGKQIVFDRNVEFGTKKVPQLFIMNSDGSNPVALTTLPSSSSHAASGPPRRP